LRRKQSKRERREETEEETLKPQFFKEPSKIDAEELQNERMFKELEDFTQIR
jgi:hypothetical protein